MKNQDYDTGISSEVFTVKSKTRLIDIFDSILIKKSSPVLDLFEKLFKEKIIDKENQIVIAGTYLTGLSIAKALSNEGFTDITIVDIYPHLEGLLSSDIAGWIDFKQNNHNIKFSNDLDLIYNSDILIDTTGLGGINEEQSSNIHSKVFLIEDPIAEDNDVLLKNKNNIYKRLDLVDAENKYVLKTLGLNTKTSGTMTFTIDVLRQSMNEILSMEGVLYCSSEMTFFEEIIFKEKDLKRFYDLIKNPAIKVSTIRIFDCDDIIIDKLDKLSSEILVL
ncbi:MAG: DUF1188 family protein [Methanobrevibacter sp.]|nr:DUF1188 family protein [Methanobrevibacter sp.]